MTVAVDAMVFHAPVNVGEGQLLAAPADPTRADFAFGGWYTDATLATEYDFTDPVTGDLTLHARWLSLLPVEEQIGDIVYELIPADAAAGATAAAWSATTTARSTARTAITTTPGTPSSASDRAPLATQEHYVSQPACDSALQVRHGA
mgnify:CR=1 FL=1